MELRAELIDRTSLTRLGLIQELLVVAMPHLEILVALPMEAKSTK